MEFDKNRAVQCRAVRGVAPGRSADVVQDGPKKSGIFDQNNRAFFDRNHKDKTRNDRFDWVFIDRMNRDFCSKLALDVLSQLFRSKNTRLFRTTLNLRGAHSLVYWVFFPSGIPPGNTLGEALGNVSGFPCLTHTHREWSGRIWQRAFRVCEMSEAALRSALELDLCRTRAKVML